MTHPVGSQIGHYQVRGLLGTGAMGEVYRALDTRLGREVAIKTLPPALLADPERIARFEREARVLASLNHPNIATLHDVEQAAGATALVMELVEGDTLQDYLRKARNGAGLPPAEVIRIARQLVAALDAAHARGIVHRDLKPANVKITPEGRVKVLDFGLAKPGMARVAAGGDPAATREAAGLTADGALLGTPNYMSPEQARGLAVDARTDIWAFGCIVHELLAGRSPFARATVPDTLAAVLGAEPDERALPAATPDALRRLIRQCLRRDPRDRLRDIADALPWLDDAPASPEPSPMPSLSRRSLFVGAVSGVAGAGLALGATALVAPAPAQAAAASFQRLSFRRGLVRTARFGADGRTVLYGALWDGDVCRAYSVRPESPESSPLPLPPAAPLAVLAQADLLLALGDHYRGVMTYGTLASVPIAGGVPRELVERVKYADAAPDGERLAIVRDAGAGDQLEFPIGKVIAGGGGNAGSFSFPRVSPAGDAVAVFELDGPDSLNGRALILDTSGRRLAQSAKYFNVFGLAWKGREVWFTAAGQTPLFRNAVYAMDASGVVRVVARLPGNTTLHDIAPDGRVLIARTDDRAGIGLRTANDARDRDLPWLDAAWPAGLSADGRRLLFTESGVGGGPGGGAYLRDTDGGPAVRLSDGYAQALSPDGRWALVRPPGDGKALRLVPTGAGDARTIARAGLQLLNGRWLPDGQGLVVRARNGDGDARLFHLEIEGEGVRALTPVDLRIYYNGWVPAPDGRSVAVSTPAGVRLYPIGEGQAETLPDRGRVIGWIHEGILLSDDPTTQAGIRCVDPASGASRAWTDIRPDDATGIMSFDLGSLVVTSDGRTYAYGWHRATSDLYLVEGWA